MRLLSVVVIAALAGPALAQQARPSPGYTYFHRRDADVASHDADVKVCMAEAAKMTPTVTGAGAGGVIGGIQQGILGRTQIESNIENCMVIRGWDVERLDDARGAAIAGMSPEKRRTALAVLVGAPVPEGTPARTFAANAARLPEATVTPLTAGRYNSLSAPIADFPSAMTPPKPAIQWLPVGSAPAGPPPGGALIVVRVTTVAPAQGAFDFALLDGDSPDQAFALASPTKLFWKTGSLLERTYVVAVKPGLWRLTGATGSTLCLNSPEFEVGAGEVIFAGSFDVAGPPGPDLSLEPARAALGASAIAGALRPAHYLNGSTFPCGAVPASYLGALEVPGAEFAPGAAVGSRAPGH